MPEADDSPGHSKPSAGDKYGRKRPRGRHGTSLGVPGLRGQHRTEERGRQGCRGRQGRRLALLLAVVTLPLAAATASVAPLAAQAGSGFTTIEDDDLGSGVGQVSYQGTWTPCGSCSPATPDGSFRFSHDQGATATIHFEGNTVHLFGVLEPQGGVMTVQLDDRPPTRVDTYSPTSSSALLFSAGQLPDGTHTLVVGNTGEHNPNATSTAVSFDRLESATTLPATGERGSGTGLGSLAAVSPSDHGDVTAPQRTGLRSGQPWLSGANGDPRTTPADVDAFCAFRGSACDVALAYVPRDNWNTVSEPFTVLNAFSGWPGRLVLSVPPFPDNVGGNLGACASGAYDGHFRTFGNSLNVAGRQDSFVQLAWEPNGDWFPWSGNDPAAFIGCWRHVVEAIRATADPDPSVCWCINGGLSQNPPSGDPTELYPGDAWVDVIGTSSYDHYLPSYNQQQFDAKATARGGLTWTYEFARAHGKQFGVSEWGVASGVGGGGDSSAFIGWMRDWFQARAGQGLAYEIYYNNCERNNVGSNLFREIDSGCVYRNVNAGERYAALW